MEKNMNNKSKAWEDFLRRTLEENLWEAETLNINKTLLEELQTIKNDQEALHEHFYKYIEFIIQFGECIDNFCPYLFPVVLVEHILCGITPEYTVTCSCI